MGVGAQHTSGAEYHGLETAHPAQECSPEGNPIPPGMDMDYVKSPHVPPKAPQQSRTEVPVIAGPALEIPNDHVFDIPRSAGRQFQLDGAVSRSRVHGHPEPEPCLLFRKAADGYRRAAVVKGGFVGGGNVQDTQDQIRLGVFVPAGQWFPGRWQLVVRSVPRCIAGQFSGPFSRGFPRLFYSTCNAE